MARQKKETEWFTWQVEFKIHKTWVEDGFDLDKDRAKDLIENALPYSYSHETEVKVLKAPSKKSIKKAQGY